MGARVHVGKGVALGVNEFIGVRVAVTLVTVKVEAEVTRATDEPVADEVGTAVGSSSRFIPRAAKQMNTPMMGAILMTKGNHQKTFLFCVSLSIVIPLFSSASLPESFARSAFLD